MRIINFFSIIIIYFWPLLAHALEAEYKQGSIYIKSATTEEITDLFLQYNYDDYTKARSKFPRIYVNKLPTDWLEYPEGPNKNRTFIRMLLPLILRENENILAERKQIEDILQNYLDNQTISDEEHKLLEEKALKYDVFTRMQGNERIEILIKRLLLKIDALPPSLMIATAAIYTDWGKSRLARVANSLYMEEIWYQEQGLKPSDDDNADYSYKIYANLEECIKDRALKLNTHINYDYLREARRMSRAMQRPPYGEQLAVKMLYDNNLQNIAGIIDYTFTFYKLNRTDYFPSLRDVHK